MPYKVFIERNAEKDFRKIPKTIQKKVISAIIKLKTNPKPRNVKKISGSENYYRIRVGDYRIVYEIDDEEKKVNVFRVRHRREAYLNL